MIPPLDAGATLVGLLIIVVAAVAVIVSVLTFIQLLRRRAEPRTAFLTGLIVFAIFAILQLVAVRTRTEAIAMVFLMTPMLAGTGTMALSVAARGRREPAARNGQLLSAIALVVASSFLIYSAVAARQMRIRELLEEASRVGNVPAVRALIASGAMKSVDESLLQSLLVRAALEHRSEIVRVLLAAGADADGEGRDYTGRETTPLIAAVGAYALDDSGKAGRAKMATIAILLEAGADPRRPGTGERVTPLDVARRSRFVDVLELLERKRP